MSASPGDFLVPTLDIDLAWHTHQLSGSAYMVDTKKCVWLYVDQCVSLPKYCAIAMLTLKRASNDRVGEDKLSNSFDLTCRAWQVGVLLWYTYALLTAILLPLEPLWTSLYVLRLSPSQVIPSANAP